MVRKCAVKRAPPAFRGIAIVKVTLYPNAIRLIRKIVHDSILVEEPNQQAISIEWEFAHLRKVLSETNRLVNIDHVDIIRQSRFSPGAITDASSASNASILEPCVRLRAVLYDVAKQKVEVVEACEAAVLFRSFNDNSPRYMLSRWFGEKLIERSQEELCRRAGDIVRKTDPECQGDKVVWLQLNQKLFPTLTNLFVCNGHAHLSF